MRNSITCLFLDIGGVLLSDGWNHLARARAASHFELDVEEMEQRHAIVFDGYERDEMTLDRYLELVDPGNIHVRGYKEEGTITTPFDMTVLNDLDRFHLAMDVVDRLPPSAAGVALKESLSAKLLEHRRYIEQNGQDMPEIRNWTWGGQPSAGRR